MGPAGTSAAIFGGTAGSTNLTAAGALDTYAAPSSGTAAVTSITVSASQTVLVTLTTTCSNSTINDGCYMSFKANNGASPGTAADSLAVGAASAGAGTLTAGSASYLVNVAAGTTTFTGVYKRQGGGTATFLDSRIIVQVF
jgi:hypothetical protein